MLRSGKVIPFALAFIMVCTVFAAAGMTVSDYDELGAEAAPTRARPRFFSGTVGNLTNKTYYATDHEMDFEISAVTTDGAPPPNTQTTTWPHVWLNETIWEFSIEVDIDADPQNQAAPIDIIFTDWYGWNESSNGRLSIIPPSEWYAGGADRVLLIGEGTQYVLEYTPGVFGDLNFTILNGSSNEPLENVSFSFPNHPLHNTLISQNATDENGNALFERMQLGLDTNNQVLVQFNKEHFHMVDFNTYETFELRENVQTDHTYTMIEDPLVAGNLPLDGTDSYPYVKKDKTNIWVEFHEEMDPSSVSDSSLWLEDIDEVHIPVVYTWNEQNTRVTLNLQQDLDFNSTYKVVVDARVKNKTGNETLWRRFESQFTTILPPGNIFGTVKIDGTDDPAPEGTSIILEGITTITKDLDNGTFRFNALNDNFIYKLSVIGPTIKTQDEYLYVGDKDVEVFVDRDTEKEITGLMVYKKPTVDIVMNVRDEDGNPIPGVTATHTVTDVVKAGNDAGEVFFNESEGADVLANTTTQFVLKALHYLDKTVHLETEFDDIEINVTMTEEDLPVVVETFTAGEILVDNSIGVLVDSTFHLKFNSDMNPETMGTDNIKIIDPSSASIQVSIESDMIGEVPNLKRWIVTPGSDLKYGTDYTLWISDEVATMSGTNPLWKDLVIRFTTETLRSAGVSGRVEAMNVGVAGIPIRVLSGGEVLATGVTDFNGVFMLDVKMYRPQYFPVTIEADGTDVGLTRETRRNQTLNAGGSINGTQIELFRLSGWFSYDYVKDDNGLMPVDQTITLRFNRTLMPAETPGFARNFTLLIKGALPVPVTVNITGTGNTVQVKPVDPLQYDMEYVLNVSHFPDDELYKELRFVDGSKALIMGELIPLKTEFKPITVSLRSPSDENIDNVTQDEKLNIYFSPYPIKTLRVEEAIEVVRASDYKPLNLTFQWTAGNQALEIEHDPFDPLTEYLIRLPMGRYGENGYDDNDRELSAWLREDFEISITTGSWQISWLYPTTIPSEMKRGITTLTMNNPSGYNINVAISIRSQGSQGAFKELVSVNMTPLEENKQVPLDLSDYAKGNYEVKVEVTDMKGNLLNEYSNYILITEDGGDLGEINPITIILIVVVVIIILFVIVFAVFMYVQNKNRQEEEEIREEFECPECHNIVSADDTVCPNCGAEFEEEAYKCPKCSAMLDPEDEECPECGYDFSDMDQMELEDEDDEDMDISEEFEAEDEEEVDLEMEEEDEEMDEIEEEEEED
ncbi:MAG: Ig-like domain-containing protein [Thermoplasmatota archaeon]